ncbi:glycerophosphodiester phosphodiesterase family protein [Paenibacillus chartarius]|uniref:Glycerophosphodiester phosphodiesterase family protein n=1 Tax=Paenibacillus chartarius TaxID=747481 RepID=A0ABV6DGN1_9BACL
MFVKSKFSKFAGLLGIASMAVGLIPPGGAPSAQAAAAPAADTARPAASAAKTLTAPIINGSLEESFWNTNVPMQKHIAPGDAFPSSSFGLLWDQQYLYIGVKTEDGNMIHDGSGDWFEQDSIHLFFDSKLHQSAPFQTDDMQIGLVYQPGSSTPEFHFGAALNGHSGKDEKKILRAIAKTAEGWSAEVAVPWDMLNLNPLQQKQFGLQVAATDRYGAAAAEQRSNYWSAFNSSSFWNDTSGYGVVTLDDTNPVQGEVSPVLLQDNFDGYAAGTIPAGWISDVNSGSPSFTVVQDTYGNGSLIFDGNASGKQARLTAPVQWDNYAIQADVRFDAVLNSARWAAIMFRGAANGKQPYDQMAIRQNGSYEVAYRKPDNNWYSPTPVVGNWKPLALKSDYTMKVRVVGNNVKEYLKAKSDADFTKVTDQTLSPSVLLERGKIGFQADQSKVAFDNLIVTRITADRLDVTLPNAVEALTGPVSVTASVYFSDGITEHAAGSQLKLYSSDETVLKVIDGQLYPIKAGTAKVTAVYLNAERTQDITVTPSTKPAAVKSLRHEPGYILATAGQALALNTVAFQADMSDFSTATITGENLSWKAAAGTTGVQFADGTMTAASAGVYTVTAEKDGASVQLAVVAKGAADAAYVLYENNFDAEANGTLPQGWTRKEGTTASKAVVKNGAFELDALTSPDNPSRVLLPAFLGKFGDYKIEADVTNLAANDAARWNSIMYRIQNGNFPYYQMAVRKDATAVNGVEFAERTPDNAWNVMEKGSYTEAIDPGKMYRYTIIAHGNRVREMIDGKVIVDTDLAGAYATGMIGLQANGSKMKLDNLRVTLQQEALPPMPGESFVQVTEPDTKIAMAASVVTEIRGAADLAKLSGPALPATAILHINSELQVVSADGSPFTSVAEAIAALGGKTMPAFYIKDEETADRLAAYLEEQALEDVFVVSADAPLINRMSTLFPMARGIVDYSGRLDGSATPEQLLELRGTATRNKARIAIIPANAATSANVTYLQERMITVWAKAPAEQGEGDTALALHKLITSGVNGLVTDSPAAAFDALHVYNNETTLIRKPYIIAHRGIPSEAPENTLESNALGLDYGADYIENDIMLSKDGHMVIMHDTTVDRTTNGTGKVEDKTLAELRQLNANKQYPVQYPYVQIPTFEEQIDLAMRRGKMIMAEMKSTNPAAVEVMIDKIRELGAAGTINTMSFDGAQLRRISELMPEMPVGLLTGGYASETNVSRSLRSSLKAIQGLNASLNTSYTGLGPNFMEASKHRGFIISPWTLNNKADFTKIFMLGAWGITTDYASYSKDWTASVKAEQDEYTVTLGGSRTLPAIVETYRGDKKTVAADIVLLDGHDVADVADGQVIGKKRGIAHALLRYTTTLDAANQYDMYSQPVTLRVLNGDASLSGLQALPGNLARDFASGKADYVLNIGRGVPQLRVTPQTTDANATVKINGAVAASGQEFVVRLASGDSTVTVEVTAEDGMTKREYTIAVKRIGDNGKSK